MKVREHLSLRWQQWLHFFTFAVVCLLSNMAVMAQQEIGVRVQVNRLPQGGYPTKIYQFQATPGLITVTLTNRINSALTVYLTGSVTGDNGVKVITARGYQPGTIELKPLETRILNAVQAGNLFDPNYLVYTSGSTSIKSSVFGEQGLPEGAYQICVRAFNKATREPLSEEDPLGCSNVFTITTLEPPVILNPFPESFILPDPVQNIPIRWTTPPGAPPSVEYQVRIVELFNNRHPNDAMLATPTPFFETTVRGTPLLLYSMQYPRLQEGRKYAMMVTATDPLGGATFRNRGRSEVVQFIYGRNTGQEGTAQNPLEPAPVEYATHSLHGRLLWTFKKTEQPKQMLYVEGSGNGVQQQLKSIATPSTTYANSNFALQAATTPLIKFNTVQALGTDNTLLKSSQSINKYAAATTATPVVKPVGPSLPTGILAASQSSSQSCTYESIVPDSASERFPLANMNITLSSAKPVNTPNGPTLLLATGKTDQEGNFSFHFLHPSYASNANQAELVLSVQTADFETTSFRVPGAVLNGKSVVDLGSYVLLARSYRFFTKITFSESDDESAGTYGVHIYREMSDVEERPYLMYEGQTTLQQKKQLTIDGRRVVEIASDSITRSGKSDKSSVFTTLAVLDARGAGRIFYGGKLYVKIIPASSGYHSIGSEVTVLNMPVPSNKILQAKASYTLRTKPSHIAGTVAIYMDEQNSIPIQGAIVRILYKTADVVPNSASPYLGFKEGSTTLAGANATMNSYLNSFSNYNIHDPGITSLDATLYTIAGISTAPAVLVEETGNKKLTAQLATPVALAAAFAEPAEEIPPGAKALTITTDELGKYYINLPTLRSGAQIEVKVIHVPYEFRTFVVRSQGTGTNPEKFPLGKGVSKQVDFAVDADVADVLGRVVDDKGQPLANVRVNFKGNTLSTTGPYGMFQFKIYPGNHTVSLEKEGYVIKQSTINIPQLTNNNKEENAYKSNWIKLSATQKQQATLARIAQSPTVKASVSMGNTFSTGMFGIAANDKAGSTVTTEFNASMAVAFGMPVDQQAPQYELPRKFAVDVRDIGYLSKITGKVRFRILEEGSNTAIVGARISLFDTSNTTNPTGEWYYEGFGGTTTVTIVPPATSACVAEQRTFALAENGQEQTIIIFLKTGVTIKGSVKSGNQPLPNAKILVDDKDFLSVTTDQQGNYTLLVTAGEHTISARKQNYVGQDSSKIIPAAGTSIHFNLKGGNGKNYATLLGFAIELSAATPLANGQEKWSGAFVNMKPVNADIFEMAGNLRVPFSNLVVSFDAGNNAVPAGNVKTDLTELPVKLFGYLPAKLQGEEVVTVTKAGTGSGQLAGTIRVDLNTIQGYRGWEMAGETPLLLAKAGSTLPDKIIVFNSAVQTAVVPDSYTLIATGTGKARGKLYGFNITVNNGAVIDKNGLEMAGSVTTPALGVIKPLQIGLTRFFLNRALAIGAVEVQNKDLPALEIASWKASISNLLFNEDGFKLGGGIAIEIPRSGTSQVSFADLVIAKDGMFGGQFTIPGSGINILSVANLNTDGVPLSFGRVGNSSVYRIGGKASFKINVGIMDKAFKVPLFEVMTNGDFSVQVPANYSTSLGPFGFSVGNIYINTTDNTPFIGVQGSFRADLDFLKFEVADIKVKASASGPTYSIEKLGVKLDVPVVKTEAYVTFKDDGFEGSGSLTVPGTPVAGSISFRYYKRASGIELGAHFFAKIPPIPIGVLVTLDGIGGGFDYKSGGPNGGFQVGLQCNLSFLGMGPVVALNHVGLTVSSAGILKGYGDVVVGTYLKTGHAEVVFNGPDRTFTVQIKAEMSPLEGLLTQSVQGALVISAKPDDEYAFLGCAVQVKLLGLIDNHGELAVAVRLKNPKTRGGLISPYFQYAPDEYMRERFSGAYINVGVQLGIPKERPLEFDIEVASAKIWCSSSFQASLLLNFEEMAYRIKFGGKFDAGIEGCVADVACVGISAGLCYVVEGGRNDALGWNFSATATGQVSLQSQLAIGKCNPGCNEVVTVWDGCIGAAFKVCAAASLDVGFSQRDGIRFKARAGGTVNPCF